MSRIASRSRRVAATPAVAGFRPAALAVAAALALQPGVHAQTAVSGTAVVTTNGSNTRVTTTNGAGHRSVLNWPALGVQAGSSLYFQQPDAASTSINRVTGGMRSDIMGYLGSNGSLVLVNPAGIAIGSGAVIDTAGFTASTLDLSETDAIKGRLLFRGGSTEISVGEGAHILARGGDVVLVGSRVQVERNAVLQARGATILAAGEQVEITGRGLEGIRMAMRSGHEAVNLGTLQGDAVGIFAGTLRHSGLIQAQAVSAEGGKVVLKAVGDNMVDGTVVASAANGKGGSIDVFGERVGLLAGATLDASGATGGGSIRVGGDYQGKNPDVPNAKAVYVDAAATIKADATENGDGGRVIVWSDELTRMRGSISARGGAAGGDGGFAEVSSKGYLEYTGFTDLRAAMGRAGTLLLDPQDIVIFHTGGPETNDYIAMANVDGGADFTYTGGTSYIEDARVNLQLASSNLTITTSHDPARYPPPPSAPPISDSGTGGQITMNSDAAISWGNANKLEFLADKGIEINGTIAGSDPGSALSLVAKGGDIVANGNLSAGNISFQASGGVGQGAANIVTAANLQVNANGNVAMVGNNQVGALAGTSSQDGANGSFTFRNAQDLTIGTSAFGSFAGVTAGAGAVDIRTTAANTSITVAAPPTATPAPSPVATVSGGNVTLEAKKNIVLQGGVAGSGAVTINALAGTISQFTASTVTGASISMQAASDISLQGNLTARGGISITSDNGGISFNFIDARGNNSSPSTVDGGDVTLQAKGTISGSTLYAEGSFFAGEGTGGAGRGGTVKVASSNGSVSIYDLDAYGGSDTAFSGGAGGMGGKVTITAAGDISLGSVDVSGGASNTGLGGQGGEIHLSSGGELFSQAEGAFTLTAMGGNSGTDPGTHNGLRGGKGGLVEIARTGGDLRADGYWSVDVRGGQGGAMDVELGTAGGQGGDGGDIKLSASGRVELVSPAFDASGGGGGSEAPAGALGTFRATGTSVDVTTDFHLGANWVNDSLVKVIGDTRVFADGMFQNNNEVQLFDTAWLFPNLGVVNAGRLTSFGTNVANLTLNTSTGAVVVAAGSALYTPAFLVNQGMVQADGTLRIGEEPPDGRGSAGVPTTGTPLTNEATGVLAGTGSIVVDEGMGSVQNFGTIAPGGVGTVGALTIDANLFMQSGSTFAVDLMNTSSHDSLVVTGSAAAASGTTVAVSFLPGAAFAAGDTFRVVQTGGLDPTNVPPADKPQLSGQASGNDLLLVATSAFPAPPAPILGADQQNAQQQANNQVTTFADLFVKMSEDQEKKRIGKDDIVVTDTACTR